MGQTLLKAWNRAEKFISGVLAFLAILFAFYGVIMRYVFNSSPEWTEEIIMYMIIWTVFIISSTLAEERGHVGATFVVERFPPQARRVVEIFTGILALVFCVLICIGGYQIVYVTYTIDERSLSSLRVPLWFTYLAIPAGMTLIAVRYIKRLYRLMFRFDLSDMLDTHEMSHKASLEREIPETLQSE